MQTFLTVLVVLVSAAYLLRLWMPVFRAKKEMQLSSGTGSRQATCETCNACSGCG